MCPAANSRLEDEASAKRRFARWQGTSADGCLDGTVTCRTGVFHQIELWSVGRQLHGHQTTTLHGDKLFDQLRWVLTQSLLHHQQLARQVPKRVALEVHIYMFRGLERHDTRLTVGLIMGGKRGWGLVGGNSAPSRFYARLVEKLLIAHNRVRRNARLAISQFQQRKSPWPAPFAETL